ncbi:uncharacterized protein Gasu_21740 [Galdieria sulphuraria]|uniref:Uncharacterized protein n=1 Tax=Galdieria sulphuraria TaxID=130081 RepID=M2W425_GALSU|nr:uncharacterized protein Gasu_21740 [Galdieria sulphuraria]EME30501.1 hypothetical protein Gasu_21740 [Galdieria sulphuraria]|eukprot:XP_005707021.1 hypothetical protein Gasu_21740 [Galdieria sulphuraria]
MSGWNNSGNNYPSGTDNYPNNNSGQGSNKTKKSSGELAKDGLKGLGMAALSAGKLVYRGGKWCVDKVENVVEDHKSKGSKSGGGGSGYSR